MTSSKSNYNMLLLASLFSLLFLGVNAGKYSPTDVVESVHNYPRFDPTTGEESDNEVKFTDTAYIVGTQGLPAYILGLGLIACMLLPFCLALRCCCHGMQCRPGQGAPTEPDKHDDHYYVRNTYLFGAYYLCCLLAVVVVQLIFMADAELVKAIDNASDYATDMKNDLNDVLDDAKETIGKTDEAMDHVIDDDICEALENALDAFKDTVSAVETFVEPLPDYFATMADYIDMALPWEKNILIGCYIGIMCFIVIYVALDYLKSGQGLKIMFPLTWLVVIALTLVCTLELSFLIITCDVCMDPGGILADNAGIKSDTGTFILQYAGSADQKACANSTSLEVDIQSALSERETVYNELNEPISDDDATTIAEYCDNSGNGLISSLFADDGSVDVLTSGMADLVSCKTINTMWVELVEKSICEFFTSGLYYFWLSKHISALFLYLMLCLSSLTWHYFEKVHESDIEGDDDYNKYLASGNRNYVAGTGGIVVKDDQVADHKKERKVTELTTRGRLRGLFSG
jgi:hypothetical protein